MKSMLSRLMKSLMVEGQSHPLGRSPWRMQFVYLAELDGHKQLLIESDRNDSDGPSAGAGNDMTALIASEFVAFSTDVVRSRSSSGSGFERAGAYLARGCHWLPSPAAASCADPLLVLLAPARSGQQRPGEAHSLVLEGKVRAPECVLDL